MAGNHAPVSIGGALQEALSAQGLGYLLPESRLRGRWVEVMGERAAPIAELDSLRNFVLTVKVADGTWRQELHFQREAIRGRANQILGGPVVRDVQLR